MERIKHALNQARIERDEKLGVTKLHEPKTHPNSTTSSYDLRKLMFVALVLMALSVIGMLFLFWYISDVKSDFNRQDEVRLNVSEQLSKASETNAKFGSISEQLAYEVNSSNADPKPSPASGDGDIVDVYYGNTLIRMQVIGKLSGNDADYVAALDKLKQGSGSTISPQTVAKADAKTARAKEFTADGSVDHFNRVLIEQAQQRNITNKLTFADRIQQAVEEETGNTPASSNKDIYIASLNQASEERKNEIRIIKVQRGDSLWLIAKRAYGTGFEYPRIFKANPHLTNPDKIKTGDFLRVPL